MDWTERINGAIAYIEANLTGEIDMERLGRIAGCSVYNFQRLFSYIADKPLSQYIRERRMTMAALEVLGTEARLIDIALRYGYESQDAFARAFRLYHGVLPSTVRKETVTLKSCPRLSFRKPEKGASVMQYRMEQWPAFAVAGYKTMVRNDEAFAKLPGLWKDIFKGERIKALHALFRQADYRPEGILGVCVGGSLSEPTEMAYFQAVTTWVDAPDVERVDTPVGMEAADIPAANWMIIEANGDAQNAVQAVYKWLYNEWLPTSGYALADVPAIESYMQDNRQNVWVAVEKK